MSSPEAKLKEKVKAIEFRLAHYAVGPFTTEAPRHGDSHLKFQLSKQAQSLSLKMPMKFM